MKVQTEQVLPLLQTVVVAVQEAPMAPMAAAVAAVAATEALTAAVVVVYQFPVPEQRAQAAVVP